MPILTESDPRTYAIIGAAMEVHRQLGCGFLEPVYQEALAVELANQAIPFRREQKFPINYKGCSRYVLPSRLQLFRLSDCRTESPGPAKFY
jgi:hypothetical protein